MSSSIKSAASNAAAQSVYANRMTMSRNGRDASGRGRAQGSGDVSPTRAPIEEKSNQREQVKQIYEATANTSREADVVVENAREVVKNLYSDTRLETTQKAVDAVLTNADQTAEKQRVQEEQEIRGAMAADKARAQEARLSAQRQTVRDRVRLATNQSHQEAFEAHALAREMVALNDANLDRADKRRSATNAMNDAAREDVQQSKVSNDFNVRRGQERSRKQAAAGAKRLDMITPGSFEAKETQPNRNTPNVNLVNSLRQRHDIDLNIANQSQKKAHLVEARRVESAERLAQSLNPEGERTTSENTAKPIREVLAELKANAAQRGVVTLDTSEQASQEAEEVLREVQMNPERSIASQSQVSMQAALKVLQ